jgi:putative two-component system response regulator
MKLGIAESPRMARGLPGGGQSVLVVDDNPGDVRLVRTLLTDAGYTVHTATNGRDALAIVAREQLDLVLSDVMMPEPDGFEVCREIKKNPATRLIPVVLITGLRDVEDKIKGIDAGADDFLAKPFNFDELTARVRSLCRLKKFTDDLESAESVITSLALTIEARDRYTEGHCERLARFSTALGSELGLPSEDLSALQWGGILHDVGKIGVADAVLQKPASLTLGEYQAMKLHTVIGERLCGELHSLRHVRPIVRHHHERLDGTGYPDGLRHDAIPLLAQIMGIVDVYDALTTERPYRHALSQDIAFQTLVDEATKGWRRRDLVDAFIDLCQRTGLRLEMLGRYGASFSEKS